MSPVARELGALLTALETLAAAPDAELRAAVDLRTPVCVARAPGRLDVMGGFADYSGGGKGQGREARARHGRGEAMQRTAASRLVSRTVPT